MSEHARADTELRTDGERRALEALDAAGVGYERTRHGRVSSLAEAAAARGIAPADLLKTIVVRRGDDDYVLVLVPGDRTIAWPRLRSLLGVNRMSMHWILEAPVACRRRRTSMATSEP